ncbi:hypothetical protein QQ045_032147 [Rhodiola kirilowii]
MNMIEDLNADDNNEHTSALDDESCTFVSVNGRKCWIPKCLNELKPHVGMTFPNLDEAILFYKEYARIAGFVLRLVTTNRSDGIITIKYLVCQREGFKPKSKVVITMTGLGGTLDLGVKQEFREMSLIDKQLVMECGKIRIGATKARHIRIELCGWFMNVGATVTDCKNFKRDLKLYIGLNDAQMVVDNLSDKIKTCLGYSFEYFSDEEETLTRLFWADVISRRDTTIFGDVVSLDATYRMNKYNLVFVPFTDVDNQLRSVTLAAGLSSKEDVDSYTWLLTCFKKLLQREPSVIVTDQDASIKAAIATIFPYSRHRFACGILQKNCKRRYCVGISKYRDSGFLNSIKHVIWGEYNDCKEFEEAWWDLITKYDLHDNKWMADMYDIRSSWIPVYFRDVHIGAHLRTTSRSESENLFFGRYIHRSLTLVEFFFGFNSAMDLQRQNKVQLYRESRSSVPTLNSTHKLEKSINENETGRMYIINDYGRKNASRKHNPGMFLVVPENPNQTREQITIASEIRFHVNATICSFKNDVDCIKKFHDHIYEYVKEHAPNSGVDRSSSNVDYFRVVLQMPQPADVVVHNPELSRNKGCGKRI